MAKFPAKLFGVLEGLDEESAGLIIVNNIEGALGAEERAAVRSRILAKDAEVMRLLSQFKMHKKPQFLVCSLRKAMQSGDRSKKRPGQTKSPSLAAVQEQRMGTRKVVEDSIDLSSLSSVGEKSHEANEVLPDIKESTVLSDDSSKMLTYDSNLLLFTLQQVQPDVPVPAKRDTRVESEKSSKDVARSDRLKEAETRFRQLIMESKEFVQAMVESPISSSRFQVPTPVHNPPTPFLSPRCSTGAGKFGEETRPRAFFSPPPAKTQKLRLEDVSISKHGEKENAYAHRKERLNPELSRESASRSEPFLTKSAYEHMDKENIVQRIKKLSLQSFLRYLDLETVLKALKKAAVQNRCLVGRSVFVRTVGSLVAQVFGHRLPQEGLVRAYNFLAPGASSEGVFFESLVGGLSILCKGSGIEKMSVSFHYLSQSYVGMELRDFGLYLSSIFRTLLGPAAAPSEAEAAAKLVETECMHDFALKTTGKIDAPSFHKWIADGKKDREGRNTRRNSAATNSGNKRVEQQRPNCKSPGGGLAEASVGKFYNHHHNLLPSDNVQSAVEQAKGSSSGSTGKRSGHRHCPTAEFPVV